MNRTNGSSYPFQGLEPYDEEDKDSFFGRTELSLVVAANMRSRRLTTLVGASGVGKTSLLRAGVVPAIKDSSRARSRQPRFLPIYFADWYKSGFLERLTSLIGENTAALLPGFDADGLDSTDLHRYLAAIRLKASNVGRPVLTVKVPRDIDVFESEARPTPTWLVILDQFNEFLEQHVTTEEGSAFAASLAGAAADPALPVNFLLSLRSDRFAHLERLAPRPRGLLANHLTLRPLTIVEAREAIEEPLKRHEGGEFTFSEDDVERLLEAARAEDAIESYGEFQVNPTLLQLLLMRAWDTALVTDVGDGTTRLELDPNMDFGDRSKILISHVEGEVSHLRPHERRVAVGVLDPLVTDSYQRSPHSLAYLRRTVENNLSGTRGRDVDAVVDALVERRVLERRPVAAPGGGVEDETADERADITLFHDVLAEPVRRWVDTRLDEHKKARRRDRLALVLGVSALVASGASFTFFPFILEIVFGFVLVLIGGHAAFALWTSKVALEDSFDRTQPAWGVVTALLALGMTIATGVVAALAGDVDFTVLGEGLRDPIEFDGASIFPEEMVEFPPTPVGLTSPASMPIENPLPGRELDVRIQLDSDVFALVGARCPSSSPVTGDPSTQLNLTIQPLEECELDLIFQPNSVGLTTAQVRAVIALDQERSPASREIQGTGVRPEVTADPVAVDFSDVLVGQRPTQTIRLANVGGSAATVTVDRSSVEPPFSLDSTCEDRPLPANGGCSISVTFAPTPADIEGQAEDEIVAEYVDELGSATAIAIPVVGFGITAEAFVPLSELSLSTARGGLTMRSFPLTNVGRAEGNVRTSLTGAIEVFSVSGACGSEPLAPGSTCEMIVWFAPQDSVSYEGVLEISLGSLVTTVDLRGQGLTRNIAIEPVVADLGVLTEGTSRAAIVRVSNRGQNLETIEPPAVRTSSENVAIVRASSTDCSTPLRGGESCLVTVTAEALSEGRFAAVVTLDAAGALSFVVVGQVSGP